MLRLILPTKKYKRTYIKGLKEFLKETEYPTAILEQLQNIESYIKEVRNTRNKTTAKAVSEYWLMNGSRYIGTIQVRHKPSGKFQNLKSNIYYEIRPSKRSQGYGKEILRLGLDKAKKIGLNELYIACSVSNLASRKIIEKNSGVLTHEVKTPEGNYLLFKTKLG